MRKQYIWKGLRKDWKTIFHIFWNEHVLLTNYFSYFLEKTCNFTKQFCKTICVFRGRNLGPQNTNCLKQFSKTIFKNNFQNQWLIFALKNAKKGKCLQKKWAWDSQRLWIPSILRYLEYSWSNFGLFGLKTMLFELLHAKPCRII